ncbi:hypothetical protein ILYODFUR_020346 [Ilyodon furcidens]|uniref:Uncharacterized protein n=1 Tax=Ilyodon furcidens TaxID=33524 RepID=A0ABV0T9K9_9TELE
MLCPVWSATVGLVHVSFGLCFCCRKPLAASLVPHVGVEWHVVWVAVVGMAPLGAVLHLQGPCCATTISLVGLSPRWWVYPGSSLRGHHWCFASGSGPHLTRRSLGGLVGGWLSGLAVCVLLGAVHRCVLVGLSWRGALSVVLDCDTFVVIHVPNHEGSWWCHSGPSSAALGKFVLQLCTHAETHRHLHIPICMVAGTITELHINIT